jgi:hypothetical protein
LFLFNRVRVDATLFIDEEGSCMEWTWCKSGVIFLGIWERTPNSLRPEGVLSIHAVLQDTPVGNSTDTSKSMIVMRSTRGRALVVSGTVTNRSGIPPFMLPLVAREKYSSANKGTSKLIR